MIENVTDVDQIDIWFNKLVEFCKTHPETAGYTFLIQHLGTMFLVKATNRSKVPSNIKPFSKP